MFKSINSVEEDKLCKEVDELNLYKTIMMYLSEGKPKVSLIPFRIGLKKCNLVNQKGRIRGMQRANLMED